MFQKSNEKQLMKAFKFNGERVVLEKSNIYILDTSGPLEAVKNIPVEFCLNPPSKSYVDIDTNEKLDKLLKEYNLSKHYFSSDNAELKFEHFKDYQSVTATYFTITPQKSKYYLQIEFR